MSGPDTLVWRQTRVSGPLTDLPLTTHHSPLTLFPYGKNGSNPFCKARLHHRRRCTLQVHNRQIPDRGTRCRVAGCNTEPVWAGSYSGIWPEDDRRPTPANGADG